MHLGIANVNWVFNISNKYLFQYFGFSNGYFCKCLNFFLPMDTFYVLLLLKIDSLTQALTWKPFVPKTNICYWFSQIILNKI